MSDMIQKLVAEAEHVFAKIRHGKRGLLEADADFEKVSAVFLGPTRPAKDAPQYVTCRLRVRNNGETPIPFVFNTTQRFEIELVSAEGKLLTRWSQGQLFGQVVTREELAPHS